MMRCEKSVQIHTDNRGFTLIEMIVAVGIIAVLIGAIAAVFPQWLNQYVYLRQTAEGTELVDVIATGLQDELQYSKDRVWSEEGLQYVRGVRIGKLPLNAAPEGTAGEDDCTVTWDAASERLTIVGRPEIFGAVFDTAFYGNMTARLELWEEENTQNGQDALIAEIRIYAQDGRMLSSETIAVKYFNPTPDS